MYAKGQIIEIFVTGVSKIGSLCSIWAQTDFVAYSTVDQCMNEIGVDDETISRSVSFDLLTKGRVVVAKYQADSNWYRAQIISADESTQTVKVFFIDFGNEEEVPATDIIQGNDKVMAIHPLANSFILADFEAGDKTAISVSEMETLVSRLTELETSAEVLHEGGIGLPPTLRIFTEKDSQVQVVDEILASGCGSHYGNSHLRHQFFKPAVLSQNQLDNVYISYADSVVRFWLQQVENEELLQGLEAELQESIQDLSPILPTSLQVGCACVAKFQENEIYYRGVVSAMNTENNTVKVTFVDYGNQEWIEAANIFSIPNKYLQLPSQAIECSQSGSSDCTSPFELEEVHPLYAQVLSVLDSGLHIVKLSTEKAGTLASATESTRASAPVTSFSASNFSYQSKTLKVGSYEDICISHVEPNGQFHCQLLSEAKALANLMCHMQNLHLTPLKGAFRDGTCCLARSSEDGLVYRGQVVSGTVDGPRVKFVDFGITETIRIANLFQTEESLLEVETRSVLCMLTNCGTTSNEQLFSFLKSFESRRPLVAKVLKKSSRAYELELYDTAVSDEPLLVETSVPTRQVRAEGNRGTGTELSSQSSRPCGGKLQPPDVCIGQPIQVYGMLSLSATQFFAQFVSFPVEELENLTKELQNLYHDSENLSLGMCAVGDFCVAKFQEDGLYYRARVLKVQGNRALVQFVDYGNEESTPVSELKILLQKLCHIPPIGAVFDIGEDHEPCGKDMLGELVTNQQICVLCSKQKDFQTYVTQLPPVETNAAILVEAR